MKRFAKNTFFSIFLYVTLLFIPYVNLAAYSSCSSENIEDESFILIKQGPHYVFEADINNRAQARVLLESGIPALLVDSAFVFSTGILSGMELSETAGKEKINLGGRVFPISHKAKGTVKIGKHTSYKGEVFVLPGYAQGYQAALPVQKLHNDLDNGSGIVNLDLGNNTLKMISRSSLKELKDESSKCRINTRTYMGMPAVKTSLVIGEGADARVLKGNFNIDFGNPELLFLLHQHKDVQHFLAENSDLELREARNPRGDVVAQFIIAEDCYLCDAHFSNAVLAITKNLPRFTTAGNIGLKFFRAFNVVLDFDRGRMYTVRKK